jgi:hypothetical protein
VLELLIYFTVNSELLLLDMISYNFKISRICIKMLDLPSNYTLH